jgi:hypothetical protein
MPGIFSQKPSQAMAPFRRLVNSAAAALGTSSRQTVASAAAALGAASRQMVASAAAAEEGLQLSGLKGFHPFHFTRDS